ncbi:MAG TPA: erythromycin esterase family protein, partial [Gemmataceae bacterium]|nr:erythromycin esterase family protein [Gemmataceae bacterium]
MDQSDPKALKEMIGNARVVGLGEVTHGTQEISLFRVQIAKFLIKEMDFSTIVLEGEMPEAYEIDQYVLNGKGSPEKVLEGLGSPLYTNSNYLDLITYVHELNHSSKKEYHILGCDILSRERAKLNVLSFLHEVDRDFEKKAKVAYEQDPFDDDPGAIAVVKNRRPSAQSVERAGSVLSHMKASRRKYLETADSANLEWAIQNARIVAQNLRYEQQGKDQPYRDKCMAENLEWILEHSSKGKKVMVFAHNAHIAKSSPHMGNWLSKKLGRGYLAFGSTFHEGQYAA